jgi:hypothetical protein
MKSGGEVLRGGIFRLRVRAGARRSKDPGQESASRNFICFDAACSISANAQALLSGWQKEASGKKKEGKGFTQRSAEAQRVQRRKRREINGMAPSSWHRI